ncbi:hypothetical protein Bccel_1762 [Pseudobacteroides cellulosolvens ATCC 35603 = DSM 2933]|uniref:Uncharacterized protein n=2 Tax=Pseudobacteroides cellulosolvens TaxID=35825 RepID=A0A0L6JM68_9FIRM|nr:hypothetical protein Bccel_1762 [Pseudobacteroides cellulosolvens ATCC 35603 = DSM 2933]
MCIGLFSVHSITVEMWHNINTKEIGTVYPKYGKWVENIMINELEIIANTNSLQKRRNITGEIFFKVGEFSFPEQNWNDFIIIVLVWWLSAYKTFVENDKQPFKLIFMDGSFEIKIKRITEGILVLNFFEDYVQLPVVKHIRVLFH